MTARKLAARFLTGLNVAVHLGYSVLGAAADWFWNQVFTWLEHHPVHERTPEQQAEYERQGRLADERARIHYIENARRRRKEEETP